MVTLARVGVVSKVLVSLAAFAGLVPHEEVYATLILSVTPAAALLEYLILMTLLVKVPESKLPVAPTKPVGIDHKYPVAVADVAVAAGKTGAVYLYILALHTFV